jgi:hypothetical protein
MRATSWVWRPRGRAALAALPLLVLLVGCSAAATPSDASTSSPASVNPGWVKDTVQALDIFLPDANSDYYLGDFGTKYGARTVISGKVPKARNWSFTAYPPTDQGPVEHVHDTDITQSHGRYTVTLSASCARVKGTCVATSKAEPVGIVVLQPLRAHRREWEGNRRHPPPDDLLCQRRRFPGVAG